MTPTHEPPTHEPPIILGPLVGASLGVDGGPIFQILAIENLGLSATAIGIAFGLWFKKTSSRTEALNHPHPS